MKPKLVKMKKAKVGEELDYGENISSPKLDTIPSTESASKPKKTFKTLFGKFRFPEDKEMKLDEPSPLVNLKTNQTYHGPEGLEDLSGAIQAIEESELQDLISKQKRFPITNEEPEE